MYLSATPKFPAQSRIVCCTITEGSSALRLISFINPLNAVAAGSPPRAPLNHHLLSLTRRGALPSAGLGDHRAAAGSLLGKEGRHMGEQGCGCRKSGGEGGRKGPRKGRLAVGGSLPTLLPEGARCVPVPSPQAAESHPPASIPVLSSLGVKGMVFPNGAEGPARPPTPGIPSPPAGHTLSPLFGEKNKKNNPNKHLSQAIKEKSLKTSSHCISPQQRWVCCFFFK